jgi:hypothetical protein
MKTEVIVGILIGYVVWRWFSGQTLLPSFTARDEEQMDSIEFDEEMDWREGQAIHALN